jgi:hypothetical protein
MERRKITLPKITKSMLDESIFSELKRRILLQKYKSKFVIMALSKYLGRTIYITDLHDLDVDNFFQDDFTIKKGSELIGVGLFSSFDLRISGILHLPDSRGKFIYSHETESYLYKLKVI